MSVWRWAYRYGGSELLRFVSAWKGSSSALTCFTWTVDQLRASRAFRRQATANTKKDMSSGSTFVLDTTKFGLGAGLNDVGESEFHEEALGWEQ